MLYDCLLIVGELASLTRQVYKWVEFFFNKTSFQSTMSCYEFSMKVVDPINQIGNFYTVGYCGVTKNGLSTDSKEKQLPC